MTQKMTFLYQNTETSFRLLPSVATFLALPRTFHLAFCNFVSKIV